MPRLVRFVLAVMICGCLASASTVFAQEVGDQVVPKQSLELKVKDEAVETVGTDDVLTVEQVQGKWLWVASPSGTHGWVKSDAVRPYEDSAPPSPDTPVVPEEPLDPEADRLFLIGALGGAHVYTTYAYIGVVADGLSKELYSNEQTKQLLGEVVAVSESLIKNLRRVRAGGLAEGDARAIDNMIGIYKLLQDEARAAIVFTDSRSVEDAEKFDKMRTTVWPMISELLGLESEANSAP